MVFHEITKISEIIELAKSFKSLTKSRDVRDRLKSFVHLNWHSIFLLSEIVLSTKRTNYFQI